MAVNPLVIGANRLISRRISLGGGGGRGVRAYYRHSKNCWIVYLRLQKELSFPTNGSAVVLQLDH